MKTRSKDPLKDFMKNPKQNFDQILRSRHPFKVSLHNYQMYDLGLEFNQMDNEKIILNKIRELDSEFDLVMIQEYFDESLLLLRKMLCWDMDDIVYLTKGVRSQNLRTYKIDDDLRSKISSWNHADVLLYKHFNETFWQKLQDYGPTFQSDLVLLRNKLKEKADTCIEHTDKNKKGSRTVELTLKENATERCRLLGMGDHEITDLIRNRMIERRIPLFKVNEYVNT